MPEHETQGPSSGAPHCSLVPPDVLNLAAGKERGAPLARPGGPFTDAAASTPVKGAPSTRAVSAREEQGGPVAAGGLGPLWAGRGAAVGPGQGVPTERRGVQGRSSGPSEAPRVAARRRALERRMDLPRVRAQLARDGHRRPASRRGPRASAAPLASSVGSGLGGRCGSGRGGSSVEAPRGLGPAPAPTSALRAPCSARPGRPCTAPARLGASRASGPPPASLARGARRRRRIKERAKDGLPLLFVSKGPSKQKNNHTAAPCDDSSRADSPHRSKERPRLSAVKRTIVLASRLDLLGFPG